MTRHSEMRNILRQPKHSSEKGQLYFRNLSAETKAVIGLHADQEHYFTALIVLSRDSAAY